MPALISARTRKGFLDYLGGDVDAGELRLYDGIVPATADAAPAGNLLVTFTLNADAFQAATDDGTQSTIVANAIANSVGVNTGQPTFGRIYTSGTLDVAQIPIEDITLDVSTIANGATVVCNGVTIRLS